MIGAYSTWKKKIWPTTIKEKFELLQRIQDSEEKKEEAEAAAVEARACTICLANLRNVALLPCSHASYCEECVDQLRRNGSTCPACTAAITDVVSYIL